MMRFAQAIRRFRQIVLVAALSLVIPGVALAAAAVESRSAGSPSYSGAGSAPEKLETLKKMEFLQQEIQELRGKVEEQAHHLQELQEHQKKLYQDLDRRLREAGGKSGAASTGISIDGQDISFSRPTVTPTADNGLEEKTYQQAYQFIQNKEYDAALVSFQSLVTQFPQTKYMPNAQYWLGEIYLVKGNTDLATQAFSLVAENYAQHPKAADCLLKLGYLEYTKGQWKRSQALLTQVQTQFPGTTSAQLAQSRLQKMREEGRI